MAIHTTHISAAAVPAMQDRGFIQRNLPVTSSTRFAERLDRIATQEALLKKASPEELQQAAEALRLSSLRSSLAMLSDTEDHGNELLPTVPPLPQLSTSLQA